MDARVVVLRYHGYARIDPMAPVKQHVPQDQQRGLEWLRLIATRAADGHVRKQAVSDLGKIGFKIDPGWQRRAEWT